MDVLPRHTADAIANMSADYLLLEHYPRPTEIRFRPFAWSEPSYTFGVSQSWKTYRAQVPAEIPLVRRCTGGGLVSHLHDWTFALVIPPNHLLYEKDASASYLAIHQALAKALQKQGQPVDLVPAPPSPRPFHAPDQCAERAEPHDLIRTDTGKKVAGAAQKRNRKGLLIEVYVWQPSLPNCQWGHFETDFVASLSEILKSPAQKVPEPIYDQFDHEGAWAKFASPEWNQRL